MRHSFLALAMFGALSAASECEPELWKLPPETAKPLDCEIITVVNLQPAQVVCGSETTTTTFIWTYTDCEPTACVPLPDQPLIDPNNVFDLGDGAKEGPPGLRGSNVLGSLGGASEGSQSPGEEQPNQPGASSVPRDPPFPLPPNTRNVVPTNGPDPSGTVLLDSVVSVPPVPEASSAASDFGPDPFASAATNPSVPVPPGPGIPSASSDQGPGLLASTTTDSNVPMPSGPDISSAGSDPGPRPFVTIITDSSVPVPPGPGISSTDPGPGPGPGPFVTSGTGSNVPPVPDVSSSQDVPSEQSSGQRSIIPLTSTSGVPVPPDSASASETSPSPVPPLTTDPSDVPLNPDTATSPSADTPSSSPSSTSSSNPEPSCSDIPNGDFADGRLDPWFISDQVTADSSEVTDTNNLDDHPHAFALIPSQDSRAQVYLNNYLPRCGDPPPEVTLQVSFDYQFTGASEGCSIAATINRPPQFLGTVTDDGATPGEWQTFQGEPVTVQLTYDPLFTIRMICEGDTANEPAILVTGITGYP